jgi:hypothetical protein
MSSTTILAVTPERRPMDLVELRNSHGWSPSIWRRLLRARGWTGGYIFEDDGPLDDLWQSIDTMPEWQQAPLVLTFDVGVIPWQAFEWAAEMLDEFERRLPANPDHVNHVPTVAALLKTKPEAPLIGAWGTSVTENPFDPWDEAADEPGSGLPLTEMFVLRQHRAWAGLPVEEDPT